MSIKLMSEVWTRELPHPEQSVLLALADHADDEGGSVFPSLALVAWKTGYSTRQVRRIVRTLEDRGALVLVAEATRYRPNEYRIVMEAVPAKTPFRADNLSGLDEPRADIQDTRADIALSHRADIALSARTITEPPEEPSDNSGSSTANLEDLGKPSDPEEPEGDTDFLPDRPAPNPSDRQVYFIGRLQDRDDRWKALTFGGVVRLNKDFGRPVVAEALGYAWEEAQGGADTPAKPFALVRSICERIASEQKALA